jgi:cobalamin biosynthesis protein CobT
MSGTKSASDTTSTPSSGLSVAQASDAIATLLAREDGQPDEQEQDAGGEPEGEEPEEQSDEPEDETQAEPEEGEAGAEGEEDAEGEGEEPEEPDPATTLVTVEIDGKAQKVTLEEVTKGYLRTADYTRKTQQLAEERRAFGGEIAAVREERAQYAALLPALAKQLEGAAGQEPDWDRLAAEDPIEFNRQWAAKQLRDRKLSAIQSEQQRIAAEAAREADRQRRQVLEAARAELPRLNPAWKDANRWRQDRDAVKTYLGGLGYSDDQIAALDDPRAVLIAHKARLYDEGVKRGMQPRQQVQAQQRPAPAAAARPGPARRPVVTEHTRAKQRLAKTHDVRDAASVIEGLL